MDNASQGASGRRPDSAGSDGRRARTSTHMMATPGVRADEYYEDYAEEIDACLEFRRTARLAIGACDRYLAAFRLTDTAAALLLALRNGSASNPARLAERVGVRRSSLSTLLGRLERDGWIDRSVDPRDRRRRLVRLTDAGRSRFDILLGGYYWIAATQLTGLSPAECAEFRHSLSRIRFVSPPPPPRGRPEMGIPYEEPFEEWLI